MSVTLFMDLINKEKYKNEITPQSGNIREKEGGTKFKKSAKK